MSTRQYYYDKKRENIDALFKEKSSILSSAGLSTADVLRCISDKRALLLFRAIALSQNWNNSILMTKLRLTRKQYYLRMQKLMRTGLIIKRIDGKYHLTSLGKIIFDIYGKIETAVKYYWKLKAVDTIMMMMSAGEKKLPAQECQRIIDTLIHNQEIKDIILVL